MPVEIREIAVHFNLVNADNQNLLASRDTGEAGQGNPARPDAFRDLVDACVAAVLQVLKDKEER